MRHGPALAILVAMLSSSAAPAFADNTWTDSYRKWPWLDGTTETVSARPCHLDSSSVHCGQSNQEATDINSFDNGDPFHAVAGGTILRNESHCNLSGAGNIAVVRDDRDPEGTTYLTYEHLKDCVKNVLSSNMGIVPGQLFPVSVGQTGTNNAHLHFQRSTQIPTFDPTIDRLYQKWSDPVSAHGGVEGDMSSYVWYTSDNAPVGYTNATTKVQSIVSEYYSTNAYLGPGVTANVTSSWSPCVASRWAASCSDASGVWGKFQTYKYGPLDLASAIGAKNSSSTAYWIPRGVLGAYTSVWGGQKYLYWIGFPISRRNYVSGTLYRQYFDPGYYGYGGYINYDALTCQETVYRFNSLGQSFSIGSYNYC